MGPGNQVTIQNTHLYTEKIFYAHVDIKMPRA
nr:MAG TPA: hypothetical protein [Caudoviricetes sp.]DAL49751.1 MAG TPA_asm: hypothetical protein [Caudoviricetes sp.]